MKSVFAYGIILAGLKLFKYFRRISAVFKEFVFTNCFSDALGTIYEYERKP